MTEILHENTAHGTRTVQLSQEFGYDQDVTLTVAHIDETYVNLVRIKEVVEQEENGTPSPQEKIALSMAECNALFAAVVKYESDMASLRIAEELRQKEVKAEAMELAFGLGLTIEERPYGDSTYYTIGHLHRIVSSRHAHTIDELLQNIKRHQADLDKEVEVIKDANEIAAFIAASSGNVVSITPEAPSESGLYDLKITGNKWSHCSMDAAYAGQVYNRLESIKRDIDRETESHAREVRHHEAASDRDPLEYEL